jgi:hypothetical protein
MRPKQKAEMPANTIVKIVLINVELENASSRSIIPTFRFKPMGYHEVEACPVVEP